jgi:hypothetical protein
MSARLVGWIAGTGRVEREIAGVARVGATADNEIVVRVEGVSREPASARKPTASGSKTPRAAMGRG